MGQPLFANKQFPMRNLFKQIHLWLSVPFGILITLICFSGAMLIFEQEITQALHPERFRVKETGTQPLPLARLVETASASLPDSVTITGVTIPADPGRAYQMSLSKPRRASIAVNPYTGEVLGRNERGAFFMYMFRMHRWLLDSMKPGSDIFVGKLLVGTSTLLFVVVLLTGVIVWWPKTKRALKARLQIKCDKGWWRFWYDLHLAGGMYALLFLLAMALTGLTWSFPWYRTAFYRVFGVEMPTQPAHAQPAEPAKKTEGKPASEGGAREANGRERGEKPKPYAHWQQVYEQLAAHNPDYKQISISASGKSASASVSFYRLGNQRASDRYTFDARSGEITGQNLYSETENSGKIRGWIYSVHVGSWGGMTTRILYLLAALLGASLPLTGYYLWIKRLLRKRR